MQTQADLLGDLHSELVGSGPRTAWILHGILGSGRNWRSFARSLARELPDWTFVLPDLRNHGRTGPLPGPHTLRDCAADLTSLPTPAWVLGHSFGGKVALTWARDHGSGQTVCILDSVPFADRSGDSEVIRVLSALDAVPTPAAERTDLRAALVSEGLPTMLVDWLLTSAKKDPDGWRWVYDLSAVRSMMTSYFTTDFSLDGWAGTELHLVRAANSSRWRAEWITRLQQNPSIRFHTLADADHWLHVDNPSGLRALLVEVAPPV